MVLPSVFSYRAARVAGLAAFLAVGVAARPVGAQERKPAPTFTNATPLGPDEIEHKVKKGDTLWDIAKEYLKDPFRWPEVFKRNSDIVENPHWIYPGETIRIPSSEVRPEVLARVTTRPAPPPAPSERTVFSTLPGRVSDRVQSDGNVIGRDDNSGVSRGQIESAPFGDRRGGPAGSGRLAAAYDRPGIEAADGESRFQLRDRVFVNLPAGAGQVGDRLLIYRLGAEIGEGGQIIIPTGIARIESRDATGPALVSIVRQFDQIVLDQRVMPLPVASSAMGRPVDVAQGPTEDVLYISNNPVLPSLQDYVVMTAKNAAGIRVGDQFTLIDGSVDPDHPAPPVPAALAEVVRVTPFAVTAILVNQDQPRIRPGMKATLTARMP
jgi:LysM domain-containing protein